MSSPIPQEYWEQDPDKEPDLDAIAEETPDLEPEETPRSTLEQIVMESLQTSVY